MSAIFDEMLGEATELLVDVLGERDVAGELAKVIATLPHRPDQPYETIGVIVGAMTLGMVETEAGTYQRREQLQIRIPLNLNPSLPRQVQHKATFQIPRYGDQLWAVATEGSRIDANWLDYNLERQPLANFKDHTSASV